MPLATGCPAVPGLGEHSGTRWLFRQEKSKDTVSMCKGVIRDRGQGSKVRSEHVMR